MARLIRARGGAVIACAVAVLAACDSGSTASGTSITASNYHFTPASFSAPANSQVTVTIQNTEPSTKHNFTIKELGVNEDIAAGKSVTKTFTVAGSATMTYYCEYHGDEKGMKGTLTIGSGGPAGASPAPSSSAGYHY